MKKLSLSLGVIFWAFVTLAQNTTTATTTTTKSLTWSNYKIGLNAPTDLVVRENSDKIFYAGNDNVFITIYPSKGKDSVTRTSLPQLVQKWATDHKLTYSPLNAAFVTSSNSYSSYYVSGTGHNGMATYVAAIVVASHPKDAYLVWLQYKAGYAASAINILNSLSPQ